MPAIFNNITVPLLGLSDTAITGHLGSEAYMAAMAVGAMMFNVVFMLCGFLRMGTTGLTALASGASDRAMIRDVLRKSLIIAGVISVTVLLLQRPLATGLIILISPDRGVGELAMMYYRAVVWSVPAQLGIMAMSGWYIGRGNTFIPMCVSVGVNIVNILASLTLVFGLGLGFKGVAYGTLAANWIGVAAFVVLVRGEWVRLKESSSRRGKQDYMSAGDGERREMPDGSHVRWSRFFAVNTNLFLRSACIMGVSLAMTSAGARLGDVTLAANSVMMQFFLFFSYFMDGFAFAGESLVGHSIGASDGASLRRTVRALIAWGGVMALIFTLVYLFASRPITALLTDTQSVRGAVSATEGWLVALPAVTVSAFIFDGIFIGMARTRPLLTVTLVASLVFALILNSDMLHGAFHGAWQCGGFISSNGLLWLAFEAYLLLRGVLLALKYLKLQRKSLIL